MPHAIKHGRQMLAKPGPVGATALHFDFARLWKQALGRMGQSLHHAGVESALQQIDQRGDRLGTLRLEALPHESLPGKGPGHAGGNFVVTRIRAVVQPPEGAREPMVRFVRVELPGKEKLLQLAEVEVFSGGINVAPQGIASQKSTYADAAAARANAPEQTAGRSRSIPPPWPADRTTTDPV